MRLLRALTAVVLLAAVALVGGCSSGAPLPCATDSNLVPSCGVLLGIATNPNDNARLAQVERALDTRFRMIYRFHDLDDQVPTPDERALVHAGRILHISIDSRIFRPPSHAVRWADVAAGTYDTQLRADARGIAALKSRVFLTFDHEADQPQRAASGTPDDFIAAWRHVHEVFQQAGAGNAVWVWVVTGYSQSFAVAGRLWPGNAYVDWISWEAYNGSGCVGGTVDVSLFRTFAESALPFYRWLNDNAARLDIDASKPMMISEAGSVVYPADPNLTAAWYRGIPDVLHDNPQIRALALWDRPGTGNCPYQFDHVTAIRAAVRSIARSTAVRGH